MNRDERIEHLREWSSWELAEHAVDLEDMITRITDIHQEIPVQTTAGIQSGCSSCESDSMTYPWPCLTAEILMEASDD
ncbi:hypothetical protein RGQ21_68130 [Kitasatospora aureofaciens]|nr:hypothetical protein RGQ21_68130 [Kitasatospora aureofaciens]